MPIVENPLLDGDFDVANIKILMTKAEFLNRNPDDGFLYEYDGEYAEQ